MLKGVEALRCEGLKARGELQGAESTGRRGVNNTDPLPGGVGVGFLNSNQIYQS